MEFLSVENLLSDLLKRGKENENEGDKDRICLNKVEIRPTISSGNGLFALSPISAGDILIEIPFKECISIDRILKSPLSIIFEDNPDLLSYPDEALCIGLLYGLKHPECEWRKHIDTMPKSYNLTIFWSQSEVEDLRGSMLYHLTGMLSRQIQNDWESLHSPISQNYPEFLSDVTIDDYKWAISTVYSRAIGFPRNGQYVRCIVPLVDMVNHHLTANHPTFETFAYRDLDDSMLFVSTRAYREGEECYAHYGPYCNSKLLYTYGFVLPPTENCPRAVDMWLTLSQSVPFATVKQNILQSNSLTQQQWYDFRGTLRGHGVIARELIITARIIQATEDEIQSKAILKAYEEGEGKGMISWRNERATYLSLIELMNAKITLLAERLSDLSHESEFEASDKRQIARQVLREEKQTVEECFERVKYWLGEMDKLGESFVPHDSEKTDEMVGDQKL